MRAEIIKQATTKQQTIYSTSKVSNDLKGANVSI